LSRRKLNLNGLKAFECAARHLSFKRAADELMVTHTAISYHVRQLEESLGVRLFERGPNGIELTTSGTDLYPRIKIAFDGIVSALDEMPKFSAKSVLKVSTTPSFASRWLVPRLRSWRDVHGGSIDVHLTPTLRMVDLMHNEADVAIRCGVPPWPGLVTHELLSIHITPVCSSHYLTKIGKLHRPADLLDCALLHADVGQNSIGTEWHTWFEAANVTAQKRLPGMSFKDPALAWQAAINGVGYAIGYLELVKADLESGQLVTAFDLTVRHPFSYYIAYPATRKSDPRIAQFLKWTMLEARRDRASGKPTGRFQPGNRREPATSRKRRSTPQSVHSPQADSNDLEISRQIRSYKKA